MLEEVLRLKPSTWEQISYQDSRYHNFAIREGEREYLEVVQGFEEFQAIISEVKRVQNPYLFGRFILRKEQMQVTRGTVAEVRRYHAIAQEDITVVCEHNMDPRRYTVMSYGDKKHPRFYKTPNEALSHFMHTPRAVVVVKVLDDGAGSTCMDWDTEYYPEYLVLLDS